MTGCSETVAEMKEKASNSLEHSQYDSLAVNNVIVVVIIPDINVKK